MTPEEVQPFVDLICDKIEDYEKKHDKKLNRGTKFGIASSSFLIGYGMCLAIKKKMEKPHHVE